MAAANRKKKSRLGITLFGLIFLLIGLGALVFGPLTTLYEHAESSGWQRVPATLESVNVRTSTGSDSTTYAVEAAYRYRYSGQSYYGTRVGYDRGSDNIGDYHHNLASRLRHASNRGTLRAWVNPDAPSESYLVRELRWEKMLFMTLFSTVFGGAGLFITLWGRNKADIAEAKTAGGASPSFGRRIRYQRSIMKPRARWHDSVSPRPTTYRRRTTAVATGSNGACC